MLRRALYWSLRITTSSLPIRHYPARVYDTLTPLESEFGNWPDEIYLVSTIIETPWWVHALRVGNRRYYEMSEAGTCLTEFESSQLIDVTQQ